MIHMQAYTPNVFSQVIDGSYESGLEAGKEQLAQTMIEAIDQGGQPEDVLATVRVLAKEAMGYEA